MKDIKYIFKTNDQFIEEVVHNDIKIFDNQLTDHQRNYFTHLSRHIQEFFAYYRFFDHKEMSAFNSVLSKEQFSHTIKNINNLKKKSNDNVDSKNDFEGNKKALYMLRLCLILEKTADQYFIDVNNNSITSNLIFNQLDRLIKQIESAKLTQSEFKNADRYLARKWCRLFRFFIQKAFRQDCYYRDQIDVRVLLRRGISSSLISMTDYYIKLIHLARDRHYGKMIVLAEEWENRCFSGQIISNPHLLEASVLDYFDSDALFTSGLAWIDMLITRFPGQLELKKWKIKYIKRSGDISFAQKICDEALEDYPLDFELHCMKSHLFYLDRDFKNAQKSALMATSCNDSSPLGHVALAFAYLYDMQYSEALSAFNRVIERDPEMVDAYRGSAKALSMCGNDFDAMYMLRQAIKKSPNNAGLYHDLADVFLTCGYYDECKRYCKKCLAIDTGFAPAYVLLGMLKIRGSDYNSALSYLDRSLRLEPDNPIALNEMAYAKHMLGHDDECLHLLERAYEIAPDFADVVCSLGVVYYFKGDFDTAHVMLDRSIELDPDHVGAMATKANAFLAQSMPEEALVWFDRALSVDPAFIDAVRGKIDTFRSMGLEDDATEWMQIEREIEEDN